MSKPGRTVCPHCKTEQDTPEPEGYADKCWACLKEFRVKLIERDE